MSVETYRYEGSFTPHSEIADLMRYTALAVGSLTERRQYERAFLSRSSLGFHYNHIIWVIVCFPRSLRDLESDRLVVMSKSLR